MKLFRNAVLVFLLSTYLYMPAYSSSIDVYIDVVENIKKENLKISEEKISFYFNDNYLFTFDFKEDDLYGSYDYFILENEMHIIIKDENKILYYKYNDLGKKILYKDLGEYNNLNNIKLYYDDTYLNVIFDSNKFIKEYQQMSNICVLQIDEKADVVNENVYGGKFNENLIDCLFKEGQLYLFIKREKNSSGDFSNHGNYVLAIIKDEEVIEQVFFNEESFQNIIFGEEELRLSFLESFYSFDYDLNQLKGSKFGLESICSIVSNNKVFLRMTDSKLYIQDINSLEILYEYDMNDIYKDYYFETFVVIDNSVYLIFKNDIKCLYLKVDVFDTRNFVNEIHYLDGISQHNEYIEAWEEKIKTQVDTGNFNSSVDGEYEIKYSFLEYSKTMKVIVDPYENVKEGGVYPVNYELYFTGTAFLNGRIINYGYIINEVGDYKLELYNCNKEKREVNFSVSKNQLYFTVDVMKKSDYVIEKGQSLYLNYSIDIKEEDKIKEIIVNGENLKTYDLKNNLLSLELKGEETGFHIYYIEKIVLDNGEEYLIDEIVTLNVLNEKASINLTYKETKDTLKLEYNIVNKDCVRYIKLYNNSEMVKKIDIIDSNINFYNGIKLNDAYFSLVYDLGDGKEYESELFMLKYNGDKIYEIANIDIILNDNESLCFSVEIYKDISLKELVIKDEKIYVREEENNTIIYIVIVVFIILILTTIVYFFRKTEIIKRIKKKYSLKKI